MRDCSDINQTIRELRAEYGIGYCINGHLGGEVSNGRDCKVLYWMLLPAPPKGVE